MILILIISKNILKKLINHRTICFKVDYVIAIVRTIGLNEDLYFNDAKNKGSKKYKNYVINNSKLIINDIFTQQT